MIVFVSGSTSPLSRMCDKYVLACARENRLCVGAVSSPIISNIIMHKFDVMVLNYCRKNDLKYSRYADDIYLSSNSYIDAPHIDFLSTTLRDFGFQINEKKLTFLPRNIVEKLPA